MPATDTIVTQFLTRGEDSLRATLQGLSSDFSTLEGKQARLNLASNALIAGGAGVIGVLGAIGAASLKSAGQIEGVEAGLTGMLGSANAAKAKIKELQQFAASTPFDFGQTAAASQQLLAMGFSGEELIPTLKAVGNAVASAGGGTEQFRGVLLALGQIRTKGKLSAEELMQMAERGIPVFDILKKKLGLTKEQVSEIGNSGIDAQRGIAALLEGMKQVGGGNALEEMSDTLPGKLSNLGDSVNQLSGSVGKLFSRDAKDFLGGVTDKLDRLRAWVDANPDLAKKILGGAAVTGAFTVGLGVLGKFAGAYNELTDAYSKATKGKDLLTAATKADDLAEKSKAVTAGIEGAAIEGVGEAAEKTTGKIGLLARVKNFLNRPLLTAASGVPALGKYTGAMRDPVTGRIMGGYKAAGEAARASMIRNGLIADPVQAFGRPLGNLTVGGAATAGALGIGAGVAANNNMRAAGYSAGQAAAYGAITGIGAAGVAAFLPGGAIAVAAGEGMAWAINQFVNKPMEQQAEQGSGLSDEQIAAQKGKAPRQKADDYFALANRKEAEAKDIDDNLFSTRFARARADELRVEADLARREGQANLRRGKFQDQRAADAATQQDLRDRQQKQAEDARVARLRNATDFYNSTQGVQTMRNGARTVTLRLPESRGDEMARQLAYNSNTAAPVYG